MPAEGHTRDGYTRAESDFHDADAWLSEEIQEDNKFSRDLEEKGEKGDLTLKDALAVLGKALGDLVGTSHLRFALNRVNETKRQLEALTETGVHEAAELNAKHDRLKLHATAALEALLEFERESLGMHMGNHIPQDQAVKHLP